MSQSVMKKSVLRILPGLLCLALPLSSCSSSKSPKASMTVTPVELRYREASEKIATKKYGDAIEILETLMFSTRATDLEDDVLKGLADSYYKKKEYILAADTYRRLLQQTPDSPYARDAQFMLAKSYEKLSPFHELDQEYTVKGINEFATYLDQYPLDDSAQAASDLELYKNLMEVNPDNASYRDKYEAAKAALANGSPARYSQQAVPALREKLANNRFSIARQYFKLKKYRAAEIFYDVVINQYADTKWVEPAWIGKIDSEIKHQNWFEARQSIEAFQQLFPGKGKQVEDAARKVTAHYSNERDPKTKE
ncbi:outer membrane protein assembly factor BamD [Chlorobaculum sp. 24CR]|jgi:outer membrane protein assembly factor BamD|uniref:outer membrane protein assembly factor BamD n=1 Tax=Chlorobaculum sp. 24CR TaxID=2508878 RepID=UPI00100B7D04|nr:outer membrane protein assembly factor BamD [Chlorobaculum sp. 24CR]RXK87748.1 outer membrane protein assembly factor BamD [Chlorobaculum sp. 24CR]